MASEDTKDSAPEAEAPETPRRSFMKGSIVAATAAAAGGIAATATTANAQDEKAAASRISGTVHAHFDLRTPPKLTDLQRAIAQIVSRGGCPTCGLAGIDLRLTAGDPLSIDVGVPVNVSISKGL